MTALTLFTLLLLGADDKAKEQPWELAAEDEGIKVYSRTREGQNVAEMKARGLMDATPHEVWASIRDYPNYTKTMPYTEDAKVISNEGDGKVIHFWSVVNAPLVDRRDYDIKITDESEWKEGKGFLKVSWTAWKDEATAVAKSEKYIRTPINDGYWMLEPLENGTKTFATYYVFTDPGGSIPKFIVNKANNTAVPNVFRAIKKVVADNRKKAPAPEKK
jgi:hypothetical protein